MALHQVQWQFVTAGWIQKESFTQLFKHFVRFVEASKEDHAS